MSILIVGDSLAQAPNGWTPPAARVLRDCLTERGLRTKDVTIVSPEEATRAIRTHQPNVVVACGDRAAAHALPGWDGSAERMRGYFFDYRTPRGMSKVLVTVHPEIVQERWVPWRHLLSHDIEKAREHSHTPSLARPERTVEVAASAFDAARLARRLLDAERLAFDIEIADPHTLACVGFAPSPSESVVFPAAHFEQARRVLLSPIPKIAQNGQFDLHFLATRCNTRVNNYTDDTLLGWHACYPELAGASIDAQGKRKGGTKRTHKSLAFFASLFTTDAWWKDYEFEDEHEMYVLNGRDCCITFDVMQHIAKLIERQGVQRTYRMELRLVWPCVDMLIRGMPIDEQLRRERVAALTERIDTADERINELVLPFLRDRIESLEPRIANLFRNRDVCPCCRNGSGKRQACWSCAGFSKKPSAKQLKESAIDLKPCAKCGGAGASDYLWFNSRSVDQKRAILYDVLRLPRKYSNGKLATDEDALKGLLGHVS